MRSLYFISVALIAIVVLIMSSIFIVDERNKALVLQFGRVVSIKEDPGLALKIPFIQEVVFYDDRILSRDEKKQDDLRRKLNSEKVEFYIGDIRDYDSVLNASKNIDYVF